MGPVIGQRVAGGRPPRSYWSNLHKIASRSAQICVPIRTKLRPNLHKFASRSAQNCVPICTKLRPDLHKIASQSAQICVAICTKLRPDLHKIASRPAQNCIPICTNLQRLLLKMGSKVPIRARRALPALRRSEKAGGRRPPESSRYSKKVSHVVVEHPANDQ